MKLIEWLSRTFNDRNERPWVALLGFLLLLLAAVSHAGG